MLNIDPFANADAGGRFFETDARREALTRLGEGLGARQPFVLVTGEPGTGKTSLVRETLARWGSRVQTAFIVNPALTRTELLEEIARRFGAEPAVNASKPQLLACLERALEHASLEHRVAVIVIDDAHDLAPELLEELRLLANAAAQVHRRLEIVLVGLPGLEARLTEPAFAALRQRVGVQCRVEPFSSRETRHHLHELVNAVGGDGPGVFPRETCREIFKRARGVPRAVNTLASEAMRRAFAAGERAVSVEHVQAAAAALWVGTASVQTGAADDARAAGTRLEPAPHGIERAESAPPLAAGPRAETAPRRTDGAVAASPPVAAAGESVRRAMAAIAPPGVEGRSPAAGDPRVREWVGRFIGENEPRFGTVLRARKASGVEAGALPWRASFAPAAEEFESGGAHRDPGHAVLSAEAATHPTAGERPADAPTPVRESGATWDGVGVNAAAPAPPRAGRAGPAWATPVAIAVLVLTASGALIVLPRRPWLFSGAGEPRVAATRGAVERDEVPSADSDRALETGLEEPREQRDSSRRKTAPPPVPSPPSQPAKGAAEKPVPAAKDPLAKDPVLTPVPKSIPVAKSVPVPTSIPVGESTSGPSKPVPVPRETVLAAAPPSPVAPAADWAATSPARRFALEVGRHAYEEEAEVERDRLSAESGLDAWVIAGSRDGIPVYRVVLGIYSTPERAEASAKTLIERGLISEPQIIPLPPRSQRR